MNAAAKNSILLLAFGIIAVVGLSPLLTRNRRTVTTSAVMPSTKAKLRLEKLPTPEGIVPRFDKLQVGDVSTPGSAVNAANKIAANLITEIAKNPVRAIRNLLPMERLIPSANPDFTNQFTTEYDGDIFDLGTEYKVPPQILKQVLIKESGLNPAAMGDGGKAFGIAQVHMATFNDFRKSKDDDPLNAKTGIKFAAEYLQYLVRMFGNWQDALRAYNGGLGNVKNGTVSNAAKAYADDIIGKSGIYDGDGNADAVP